MISRRAALVACAGIAALGAVLRIAPATGDFWLDEIWTWFDVGRLTSPLQVFTSIHHSNNNHLNSLFFYAIGREAHWTLYRVPSLVAGILSVPLAAWIASRRGRLDAVLAALLVATCFALVHFSSEARGYATAVSAALVATVALEAALGGRRGAGALFGVCVVLGFLSHLVFLFFYAGAIAQSGWRLLREPTQRARGARRFAALHAFPLACFALLWWVDLRLLAVGGGNPTDYAALVARTVGFSLGLPVLAALALPYAALATALIAAGVHRLRRDGDDAWILYATTIAIAPACVIGLLRPDVVAVRYFLIGITFTLILASQLLADLVRAGGPRRALGLALLALFLAGNGRHIAAFLEHGRGGYHEALLTMARQSPGSRIVAGSDHDFRNGLVLRFYGRWLPEGVTLDYRSRTERPPGGPDWLVRHAPRRPAEILKRVGDGQGNRYALAAEFDHAAISGFYWALYRNVEAGESPASARRSRTTPKP